MAYDLKDVFDKAARHIKEEISLKQKLLEQLSWPSIKKKVSITGIVVM